MGVAGSLYFPPPAEESQADDASMRDAGDSQPIGTTMKQEEDEEDEEKGGDPQPAVRATEAEVAVKTESESGKTAGVGTGEPTAATEEPRKAEKRAETAEPADEDWVKL
jgi:hypothetical protein